MECRPEPDSRWGAVRRLAERRLPVLAWAPRYSREDALADAVAGVTLGLTLVPQSIAYASLANLPVQYGLYSSFVGTMLYVLLGTVKQVSIGPTSLMALLTLQVCAGLPVQYVVLLTFLSGAAVFAMGLLRLGFLVDLISPSVTSGFTSATAVIIVVAQLKGLVGVSFVAESLVDNVRLLAAHAHSARAGDAALAAVCCTALLLLRKLKDVPISPKRRRLQRALWLVSIARNAICVCAATGFAYATYDHRNDTHPFLKLSGRVEPGLPPLSLPPFGYSTANETVTFLQMARQLSTGVLMLPLVMVLANIAIAKAFSDGARVDATQEMLTLGLCNMAGSLVHAMPTCGAFTRSAVSNSSGVRTPLAGLYSGMITLVALAFMTQYFYFLPKACLSSVLICAVIFMLDFSTVGRLWATSRVELAILGATFMVALATAVELALLGGALLSLARLVRRLMRPRILPHAHKKSAVPTVESNGSCVVVRAPAVLVYLNAEHVAARLQSAAAAAPRARTLLLDAAHTALLDQPAIEALERLDGKLSSEGGRLVVFGAGAEVRAQLATSRLDARALDAADPDAALARLAPPAPPPTPPAPHAPPAPTDPLLA